MITKHLRLFALVCTLALAGCSGGENTSDDGAQLLAADETANPLLYEITNAEGEFEGWMLGTIHALPDDTDWRTAQIETAIEDADLLLVEVPDLSSGSQIAEIFAELSTTPDIGPLPPRVAPDLRAELTEMMALSDFSPGQFDDTESWAAAIMLARVGAVGRPRNGVDRYVISQFEDRRIYGFEMAAQQLGIFDQLSPQDQRDLLEGTVREWAASRANPGHLTRAWLRGDAATLEQATSTGIMADEELREALLVGRNNRWMPVLLTHLEGNESVLVAVGAAHLVGPDGLPALLAEQGYTVQRAP